MQLLILANIVKLRVLELLYGNVNIPCNKAKLNICNIDHQTYMNIYNNVNSLSTILRI